MKLRTVFFIFVIFLPLAFADPVDIIIPLSSESCLTSFLVCPIRTDAEALPEMGKLDFCEGTDSPYKSKWKLVSGKTPVMVSLNPAGLYAAAIRIQPNKGGEYSFKFGSYADGALYVNGKLKSAFKPHPVYWTNSCDVTVHIPAEGVTILLLIGSRGGRTGFFLHSKTPELHGVLSLNGAEDRPLQAAVGALASQASRRFVSNGQSIRISLSGEPGIPTVSSKASVLTRFVTPDNTILHTTETKPFTFPVKTTDTLSFSWTPSKLSSYKFTALTEFYVRDKLVQTVSQDFFCPDFIESDITELTFHLKKKEAELGRRIPLAGLNLEIASLLNNLPRRTAGTGEQIIHNLDSIIPEIKAAENNTDSQKDQRGYFQRAYFSEADNSYQPYRIYIPHSYNNKPSPLFVYLHGYVPSYTKNEWVDEIPELTAQMEKAGSIMAVPFGRSNTDFQTIGEVDVLRVIRDIQQHYQVDSSKIYCIGYSMGGSGMWTMVQHYPDLFAGGISIAGRTDYYYWHNLDRSKLPRYKQLLIDNNNPVNVPRNFLNKGFLIFHGTQDTLVKPGHSSRMHTLLKKENIDSTFNPISGLHWIGSEIFSKHDITAWAFKYTADPWPSRVSFTSYTPKYSTCYWGTISSFAEYGIPASFELGLKEDSISISDTNVAGLTLTIPPSLRNKETVTVIRNGKTVKHQLNTLKDHILHLGSDPKPKDSLPGPLKEAFNSPFILVYSEASPESKLNALRFQKDWKEFARGTAPLITDKELTVEIQKQRNIIYFTQDGSEEYLKQFLPKTPVKITSNVFTVGTKKIPRSGKGLAFIYPAPDCPGRYTAVFAGLLWGHSLPINHKHDHVPDYIIFGPETERDGNNSPIIAGFFDMNWKFSEKLLFEK